MGEVGVLLPVLPEDFWAARETLGRIRQAAHSRNRSGDVALHSTFARLSAALPAGLRVDTGVGSGACLNYFTAIVGPSGTGKSSGIEVAAGLLEGDLFGGEPVQEFPLGSGEGLAEVFMGEVEEAPTGGGKPRKVRRQILGNALFHVDEGEALGKMLERSGATVGEALRRAWTGATLGQRNGRADTTRVIGAKSYSLGLIIGFQMETALPLLRDSAAGTPQRFVWASATDPAIPDDAPAWPEPLFVEAFRLRLDSLTMAADVCAEIRVEDRARSRGQRRAPVLDSHEPLTRVKVAALLAVLACRYEITQEDWQLSSVVWRTSCAVRDALLSYASEEARRVEQARNEADANQEGRRELKREMAKEYATAQRAARIGELVARKVAEHGGPMTRGALGRMLAGRDRSFLADGVAYALTEKSIDELPNGDLGPRGSAARATLGDPFGYLPRRS